MKFFASPLLSATTATVVAVALARGDSVRADPSSGIVIPTALMEEFVQASTVLENELDEWKRSVAGQLAKENAFFLPASHAINVNADSDARDEELRRLFLTKQRIAQVQAANPLAEFTTDSPFTLLTDDEFSDWLGRSFQRQNGGFESASVAAVIPSDGSSSVNTTDTIDWTASGCVARVKDQGMCGSCWAFAAIGALESAHCLAGHPLTEFSEQQVLSCDTESYGCDGGFPGDALAFVQRQGGVCRGDAYSYFSGDKGNAGTCQADSNNATVTCSPESVAIKQVVAVPESEVGLIDALRGRPVAVGVAAGNPTWKQYKRGVVSTCESDELDHAVLTVGFGTDGEGGEFFKIKNSWGPNWGEDGFIRLKRGVPGVGACGIIGPKSVYPLV